MNRPVTLRSAAAKLKQPEYTGENRCVPCTVVNLALGAVGAVAAAVVAAPLTGAGAVAVGLAVFVLAVLATYFRGYLVPGTPTITKRYFPDRVLAVFDKAGTGVDSSVLDGLEPEMLLLDLGVVVDDPGEDLSLDPAFADRWTATIERYRGDEGAVRWGLGELSGASPERIEFDSHPRSLTAWIGGEHLASWPSAGAALADVAAAETLPAWDEEWARRPLPVQAELLGVLRLFLDTCPTCDGEVSLSQDVVESCCRSRDVVAATCRECDDRLFEMDIDPGALADRN
jgi:hypothetical protein